MTAAMSRARHGTEPTLGTASLSIADLVLLRIAADGATRAELQRDLAKLTGRKSSSGTAFRHAAERAIGGFVDANLITDVKSRLLATASGMTEAERLIDRSTTFKGGWSNVCNALVARSLGLTNVTGQIAKALDRVEGLGCLVLQQHFAILPKRLLSPTDLRAELAILALERAFGNKIKTGLGKGSGLPAKAGRLLAGQLFKSPREVSTDGKLIVALASEVTGATDSTLDALKIALIRRLTSQAPAVAALAPEPLALRAKTDLRKPAPRPDNDQHAISDETLHNKRVAQPPDMIEFAGAVVDAARPISEGWPGNRKAFISLVWQAIRHTRPDWELTEVAFKGMLAEAHRSGHVVLAGADLKDRCDLKQLEDSKILYKNTVWHFVRVED